MYIHIYIVTFMNILLYNIVVLQTNKNLKLTNLILYLANFISKIDDFMK